MSIVCLEDSIIMKFVEDTNAFNKCVDEHFASLDANGDGFLSRSELENRSGRLGFPELELQSREEIAGGYDLIFERFDAERTGKIDREKFRSVMKELMLAKARGISTSPVLIVVQKDSLIFKAVQHAALPN
ncbi:uncharacterized protein LOC124926785 [Impatiens glandulifera]|uniref:uncharacterized protein LOC124926785 n=1 Tax=Impatiens glandulifera TaxID=253017 RepID=UPI001FB09D37|nr:uncharacterized protein LOC124926785 [Impatiens glandulifera]